MCISEYSDLPQAGCVEGNRRNVFPFKALVFDVQIYIISYFVPPQDLKTLLLVSRYFKSLATPALYQDVRLVFGLKPQPGSSKNVRAFTERLVLAQQAFSFQFLSHLERASHVRSLTWQFCMNSGSTFTGVFPLLHNLRRVHLINPHPTHIKELDLVVPPLFPRVQDVRLTGTTTLLYVMPILHSPQHLTALSLDTIQPHAVALQLLKWVGNTNLPCLRAFSLRTLVQGLETQPWDLLRENEVFSAWKEALLAVRFTVEDITLGLRTEYPILPQPPSVSPSLGRFSQAVIPVFWEVNWQELKTLKLDGIDIDTVATVGRAARLRAAVPLVDVDPVLHVMPRFWDSESTDNF